MNDYEKFIESKKIKVESFGFDLPLSELNEYMFDFQQVMVQWALKRGRAALFADTGLGKTLMQATWAQKVYEYTDQNVLILAPLCVAHQTVEEAAKFGITVRYCREQDQVQDGITITNYEMMEKFDASEFVGIVLDESSILKSHDSKTRQAITDNFKMTPFKLSCTATPSPNDYVELGNQAEFLGIMSQVEMLATFFTHDGGDTSKWRLKGHGKVRFWEWMSTWSICVRSPADLGFDGTRYILPKLNIIEHVVEGGELDEGQLFATVAQSLSERRQAKRNSIDQRLKLATDIANSVEGSCVVWCHLNDESAALGKMIDGAVEVSGSMKPADKERKIMAFTHGEDRVIVTKASIAGYGLNWQHCNNMIFAGMDDSFEAYYQAVRRCWRFGQTKEVNVHIIIAETEGAVKANIERKQAQADEMANKMVAYMREMTMKQITQASSATESYLPKIAMSVPMWIKNNVEGVLV